MAVRLINEHRLAKLQAEIEIGNMLVPHVPVLGFSLNQFHNPLCKFMLDLAMEWFWCETQMCGWPIQRDPNVESEQAHSR